MSDSEDKKIKEYMLRTGHEKPVTRRDFLGAGLLQMSATMVAPTFANLILNSSKAMAAPSVTCPPFVPSNLSALINVHLAGGIALPANLIALDKGGQLLPSYNKLGIGNSSLPIDREFNNVPFAGGGIARILAGIRSQASASTRASTAFAAICVPLRDDSKINNLDIGGLTQLAGLKGSVLPNLGNGYTEIGVGNAAAIAKPTPPLIVQDINAIQFALKPQRNFALSDKMQQGLMRTLASLSKEQVPLFDGKGGADAFSQATQCGIQKNIELMSKGVIDIDPLGNKAIKDAWLIQDGAPTFDPHKVAATLTYNALKGNTGYVSIEFGGYDYHGSARELTDAQDFQAGQRIGAILETAAILGKRVFLYVTSDGTVGTPPTESRSAGFTGDFGQAGMAWILAFDPAGRPAVRTHQIGFFNSSQNASDQSLVGSSSEMAAAAVFANYLNFNKSISKFRAIAGSRPFAGAGELDQVLTIA